jgi:type IV pilus assembly PilX-like protein
MRRKNEKGSALVFALILVLVLSVMAGSLMFLARSETWAGMNYRMMTQARYGAEAGVNAASNFLMSSNYVAPIAVPPFPSGTFVGYDTTKYPLQLTGGGNVYLSTLAGQGSTYPTAAMQTAFANAVNGSLQAGNTTVNYTASAQLMSMVSIVPFGTTNPVTVQTWQITAHGDIPGVLNAQAEVVTTLEHYTAPAFAYAAFAAGNGCGQLSFTGNGTTDSYDSASLTTNGGTISTASLGTSSDPFNLYGGNVGTNGNESNSGSNVTINGSLSVPNPTFGVCSAGNITGLSGGNPGQITGGFTQLSAPVTFPPPSIAVPLSGTPNTTPGCTVNPCNLTLSGNQTLQLTPGTYTINSISVTGNASIQIMPNPVTGQYGPVILNVVSNGTSTPIAIAGNAISNPTYDPSIFQILCCSASAPANPTIQIAGNGASAATVYAPNATVDFKGNGQFFGSVIANQLTDVGNGQIHYDLNLQKKLFTVGQYTLQSFTWNKY